MNNQQSILIMIHCEEGTGYAISSLEEVFFHAATQAGFNEDHIFWSFNGLKDRSNPKKIHCDYHNPDCGTLIPFLQQHQITTVIAFDLGYPAPILKILKQQGIKHIVSYWGASMSSLNKGLKLLAKKIEYRLRLEKPDIFIFESEAMRKTATHGRGIPHQATEVIYLGVDIEKFSPAYGKSFYAHEQLNIPKNRKIVFYSGHMEERKGVRVIVNAAVLLAAMQQLENIHFVLCGNKNDEAKPYQELLKGSSASDHVTFAGYRSDINLLMRSSSVGVIASTGWDSFTMSSVEMMASGLPLIVSNLQGLAETTQENHNGYLITPGNAAELAQHITTLTTLPKIAEQFSANSRLRAEQLFAKEKQIQHIAQLLR